MKEYITLGQFLKKSNIISSGGEAKQLLLSTVVLVNGVKEERRGRKLLLGDQVTVNKKIYTVD